MSHYDSIYNTQFYKDTGFDFICSWLSQHSLCSFNEKKFENLKVNIDYNTINDIQNHTEELLSSYQRKNPVPLSIIPNLTDWIDSLNITDFQLSTSHFEELYHFFILSIKLKKFLVVEKFPLWSTISHDLIDSRQNIKAIENIFDNSFKIKNTASPELNKMIRSKSKIEQNITKTMQNIFTKAKSADWLGGDNIVLRNGRKAIPLKTAHKKKVKGIVQDQSSTGQTIYIEPIEIIELNNALTELYFTIEEEKKRILRQLTKKIKPFYSNIKKSFNILISIDEYNTRATFAYELNAIRPKINSHNEISIEKGLNPLFILLKKNIVPLNIKLNKDRILLISGPNAGGKTVALKSVGLLGLMIQSGLFVPAKNINFPIYTHFRADIGDQQSMENDLSTFSAHMQNISKIYENANENSLILLDELGTGTDPKEGSALSQSILESLLNKNSTVIATTHLGALKVWASNTDGIINAGMIFNSKKLSPTYEMKLDTPGASYGLEIAKRMGLKNTIIHRAKELVGNNNLNFEKILEELETKQLEAKMLEDDLQKRQRSLISAEADILNKQNNINLTYKKANSDAIKEAEKIIISARQHAEKLIEKIRTNKANKNTIKKVKDDFQQVLESLSIQKNNIEIINKSIDPSDAQKGCQVYIPHLKSNGIIISNPNKKNKVRLESNGITLTLNLNELKNIIQTNTIKEKSSKPLSVHKISSLTKITLDLRGERVEQAIIKTEKHIDSAILSGINIIYILHGKGGGILKNSIHEYLENQQIKIKFHLADEDQGGAGVTIVEL